MTVVKHTYDPLETYTARQRPSPPGYSSVSWQIMSEYTMVDIEFHSITVNKAIEDALQPYKELTWEHRYMWKQQNPINLLHYIHLPDNDRHHVLIGRCLHEHAGYAIKYYTDNGNTVTMNRLIDYTFMHHINVNMKNNTTRWRNIRDTQAIPPTSGTRFSTPRPLVRLHLRKT